MMTKTVAINVVHLLSLFCVDVLFFRAIVVVWVLPFGVFAVFCLCQVVKCLLCDNSLFCYVCVIIYVHVDILSVVILRTSMLCLIRSVIA
jgi:hypothetical protein